MNKNQEKILNALNNNIPLKSLKLSADFKDVDFKDNEIQDVDFKSGEFINSKFKNVTFSNCKFIDCLFESAKFDGCHFCDCLFENSDFQKVDQNCCDFTKAAFNNSIVEGSKLFNVKFLECAIDNVEIYNLEFKNMAIKETNIKNSSVFFSGLKDIKMSEVVIINIEMEKCKVSQISIEDSSVSNSTVFDSCFESLIWNENKLFKTNIIKCKGVSEKIIQDVILHHGRTETLISVLFKNKFFLSFFIIFLSFSIYACVSVSVSKNFLYVRYIAGGIWSDPYRTDLSREVSALSKLTFDHDFRKMVNEAISFEIEGNPNRAWGIYLECISYIQRDKDKLSIYFWLINEIIIVSNSQEKWSMAWKFIENEIPEEIKQDVRLLMIELFKRKNFPDVTLKIMQKFLIKNRNNVKMFIELNGVIDNINITSISFKSKAYQMIRSFAKRRIRDYPDSDDTYLYILENAEEWIEYYSSILDAK